MTWVGHSDSPARSSSRTTDTVVATSTDVRFTVPIYTLTEAACYLGVRATTFVTWVKGYSRDFPASPVPVEHALAITTVGFDAGDRSLMSSQAALHEPGHLVEIIVGERRCMPHPVPPRRWQVSWAASSLSQSRPA